MKGCQRGAPEKGMRRSPRSKGGGFDKSRSETRGKVEDLSVKEPGSCVGDLSLAMMVYDLGIATHVVHALASSRSSPPSCSSRLPRIDRMACPRSHLPFPLTLLSNTFPGTAKTISPSRPCGSGSERRLACRILRRVSSRFRNLALLLVSLLTVSSCLRIALLRFDLLQPAPHALNHCCLPLVSREERRTV
jgi:hypothetical protein